MAQDINRVETLYNSITKEYVEEFLGKSVDIEFMFFTTGFISTSLKESGFEKIEIIEREPYPDIEYQNRRAYVFAEKPVVESSP